MQTNSTNTTEKVDENRLTVILFLPHLLVALSFVTFLTLSFANYRFKRKIHAETQLIKLINQTTSSSNANAVRANKCFIGTPKFRSAPSTEPYVDSYVTTVTARRVMELQTDSEAETVETSLGRGSSVLVQIAQGSGTLKKNSVAPMMTESLDELDSDNGSRSALVSHDMMNRQLSDDLQHHDGSSRPEDCNNFVHGTSKHPNRKMKVWESGSSADQSMELPVRSSHTGSGKERASGKLGGPWGGG